MSKSNKPFYLQETSTKKGMLIFGVAMLILFAVTYALGYLILNAGLSSMGIK
jgi:hypothetical protein